MTEEHLKTWIKENLRIETSYIQYEGNSVQIELRLVGEQEPFDSVYIHIPDGQV